jgi:hypothetical protein
MTTFLHMCARHSLRIRFQWLWHFFINSICFMCFWFGLEILRLVYKKCFLKYWTVSILFDLLSFDKSSTAPFFLQKNWIFRGLENLAKNCFSEKKSLGTSWRKSSTHFWNQRKIPLLLIPCTPNLKEFFFSSNKRRCCFLEVKGSNKIKTEQYILKNAFLN